MTDKEEAEYQQQQRKEAIEKARTQLYYQNDRVKGLHVSLAWELLCHLYVFGYICCCFTSTACTLADRGAEGEGGSDRTEAENQECL